MDTQSKRKCKIYLFSSLHNQKEVQNISFLAYVESAYPLQYIPTLFIGEGLGDSLAHLVSTYPLSIFIFLPYSKGRGGLGHLVSS